MKKRLQACPIVLFLHGCGGPDVYRSEMFEPETPFTRKFSVPMQKAREGAQLALLEQSYRIVKKEPDALKKSSQSTSLSITHYAY